MVVDRRYTMSQPHKECTIASHQHGARLKDGLPECMPPHGKNGVHVFNGREVKLWGDPIPLTICPKCGLVSAYYRCNNRFRG